MSDNVRTQDLRSVSYSSIDDEKNERRSLNYNSRNIANRRSTLSPDGQHDNSVLTNINDTSTKKDIRNKKVSFQDGTFKENQKLDYSNIESRVAKYLRKKSVTFSEIQMF